VSWVIALEQVTVDRADEFAAFRATHATVSDAIAACNRLDWLVQLAVEAISDRKYRLLVAVRAARLLTRRPLSIRVLQPWPSPLEALEIYIDYPTNEDKPLFQWGRAAMLSLVPASILGLVVNNLVWQSKNQVVVWLVSLVMVVVFAAPFALLFHALFARAMRSQLANLDDDAVVKKSLALIKRAATKRPQDVKYVMDVVRRSINDYG
jgi:hypothetical protein